MLYFGAWMRRERARRSVQHAEMVSDTVAHNLQTRRPGT